MKLKIAFSLITLLFTIFCNGQIKNIESRIDLFGLNYFIENKGQWNKKSDSPPLFVYSTGSDIYAINKTSFSINIIKEKDKQISYKGRKKAQFENELIKAHWHNANQNPQLKKINVSSHYFSFGQKKYKSKGYKKIIVENIYPKINVEYEIHKNGGIKYSLRLQAGAKLSLIQLAYQNIKNIQLIDNSLIVATNLDTIIEQELKAYYANGQSIKMHYKLKDGKISFYTNEKLDPSRELIIDPWVTTLTSLQGVGPAINKGYDVDFDVSDNLYVYGGGGSTGIPPCVAKYSNNGNLQWTFLGSIIGPPSWTGSPGFVTAGNIFVDKINEKVYVSQGWNQQNAKIIRLDINGTYDNFTRNVQLKEMWDMKWSCKQNKLIGLGGGVTSNKSISLIDTGTIVLANTYNVTGLPDTSQDITCGITDAAGEVYIMFSSSGLASNSIYKLDSSLSGHIWQAQSGYNSFIEQINKPYAVNGTFSNGHNGLACNLQYVYYYDGLNLKCFDAGTGAVVGNPTFISGQTPVFSGGIYATECNDIYVGGQSGEIYQFEFNGTDFLPIDTILIPNANNLAIYDIQFNHLNGELYISGNGFVATHNPQISCPATFLPLPIQLTTLCPDTLVVQVVNPDPTKAYTIKWYDSTNNGFVQINGPTVGLTSDTLTPVTIGNKYSVRVIAYDCLLSAGFAVSDPVCSDTVYKCPDEYYVMTNNDSIIIPGTYFDSLINKNITIINHPTFSFNITDNICPGDEYILPGGGGVSQAGTYIDSFNTQFGCDSIYNVTLLQVPDYSDTEYVYLCPGDIYTLPNQTTTTSAGTYLSNLMSIYGCDSTITSIVSIGQVYSFSQDVIICANETYILPSGQSVSNAGQYVDSLLSSLGCDSVITTNISINALPQSNLPNEITLCAGESVELKASDSLIGNYQWNTGESNRSIRVYNGGYYWVRITNPPCPFLLDSVYVKEEICPCDFILPNAFSPNGDNLNDCFQMIKHPSSTSFTIAIYNRWGNKVFQSEDENFCWDGTINGTPASADTYYYYIQAKGFCGEMLHKADVILIR